MRIRLFLVCLILIADLLLRPALARLPPYLSIESGPALLSDWVDDWLARPVQSVASVWRPTTLADQVARKSWILLQAVFALPLLLALWPTPGLGGRSRAGIPEADASGAHGTARWRSKKKLKESLAMVRMDRDPVPGLLAGVDSSDRPRTAYLVPGPGSRSPVNPHMLVLGGSGAGKTRRLVFPNLWLLGQATRAGQPNSMVMTDPKGELYASTAEYFYDLGYEVQTLNLIEPRRSSLYNPISMIAGLVEVRDCSGASEAAWDVAHAITTVDQTEKGSEDPFFQQAAESLIAAAILYVAGHAPQGQRNMASVYRLLTQFGQGDGTRLDSLFQAIPDPADPARAAYRVAALSQDRTRASILTTAAVNLRLFSDPTVAAMTADSRYSLDRA